MLHNHQDGTFLSPGDFSKGFYASENIKYVLVHTNKYIFITQFNDVPQSYEDFDEFIDRYNHIRASSSPENSWMKFNGDSIISRYISVEMVIKNA